MRVSRRPRTRASESGLIAAAEADHASRGMMLLNFMVNSEREKSGIEADCNNVYYATIKKASFSGTLRNKVTVLIYTFGMPP